jgi:hypothetical protein
MSAMLSSPVLVRHALAAALTTRLFDARGKEVARVSGDGAALEPALARLVR